MAQPATNLEIAQRIQNQLNGSDTVKLDEKEWKYILLILRQGAIYYPSYEGDYGDLNPTAETLP